VTNYIYNSIDI